MKILVYNSIQDIDCVTGGKSPFAEFEINYYNQEARKNLGRQVLAALEAGQVIVYNPVAF